MKKQLVMAKGVVLEKSFEDIYNEFQPLVNKKIKEWENTYEGEEIKSICEIYLWKAYDNYDINKNIGFGYYASIVINRGLLETLRSYRKHSDVLSLNVACGDDNSESVDLAYLIADEEEFEKGIISNIVVEQLKQRLTAIEIKVFNYFYVQDMRRIDISHEMKVSRSYISKIIYSIENKAREMLS